MNKTIINFRDQLQATIERFLGHDRALPEPFASEWLRAVVPEGCDLAFGEQTVLLLALMPHIDPRSLDPFFVMNKDLDRPYTEFGGWRGVSHGGFLPTGETAVFMLSGGDPDHGSARREAIRILDKNHWLHTANILSVEGRGDGEPRLSGRLAVSDEALAQLFGTEYEPEYNASFPARKITTPLDWNDLVLPYNLCEELDDIAAWIGHQSTIREQWRLGRIVKPGYRCLFYGPPGTGKTLTAMLLGRRNGMDVYRVDLSMVVSKYIGETEKNLARVFDKARHHNWILFFDEADALFSQRTETTGSNDRHANQEVAYLLQRIEDFAGMVILATNLKDNIDEAFFRRFQSSLYFAMPDERMRRRLWEQMLPGEWLVGVADRERLLHLAAVYDMSGGSIVNAVQSCAIRLYRDEATVLTEKILRQAIGRELEKEGRIMRGVDG